MAEFPSITLRRLPLCVSDGSCTHGWVGEGCLRFFPFIAQILNIDHVFRVKEWNSMNDVSLW